jgi:hypothetical protein
VWEYCAKSELHPRSGLEVLKVELPMLSTIRAFCNYLVGVVRADRLKTGRSNLQEQCFPGRAEFFALPQPPNRD